MTTPTKAAGVRAIVGVRDTRTAKIVGNIKPGDIILHSTGPAIAP